MPFTVQRFQKDASVAVGSSNDVLTFLVWVSATPLGAPFATASDTTLPFGAMSARRRAIKLWVQLEGAPPVADDWQTPGHPRWHSDCPTFPPHSHVQREFGSWNKALNAAGFDRPRPRAWTRGQMIDEILAYHQEHGCTPTSGSWDRSPTATIIGKRFGGWNNAMLAAGLVPCFPPHGLAELSEAEILASVRRMAMELGRSPRANERIAHLKGVYHSPSGISVRLGCTWNEVLRRAGLQVYQSAPHTREDVGVALCAYYREHGQWPTVREWQTSGLRPALSPIHRLFGRWSNAVAYAERMLDDGDERLAA